VKLEEKKLDRGLAELERALPALTEEKRIK